MGEAPEALSLVSQTHGPDRDAVVSWGDNPGALAKLLVNSPSDETRRSPRWPPLVCTRPADSGDRT